MKCYNCNSVTGDFYAEENGYTLVKCAGCGLLFVENPPSADEIDSAHRQGLHRGEKSLNVTGRYNAKAVHRYVKVLEDLFDNGIKDNSDWLDVGCGHGEFLEALGAFSNGKVRAVGSEPNEYKQKSAKERGHNVDFIELETHDSRYDYVSLLDVYSHLPDPVSFILTLRSFLRPSGELVVKTGDTADLEASDHYRPFYLPDHLSFASERILVDILQRSGFEVIKIRKYPYRRLSASALLKEFVKIFLPNYKSVLFSWLMNLRKWKATKMYIRARKNEN